MSTTDEDTTDDSDVEWHSDAETLEYAVENGGEEFAQIAQLLLDSMREANS